MMGCQSQPLAVIRLPVTRPWLISGPEARPVRLVVWPHPHHTGSPLLLCGVVAQMRAHEIRETTEWEVVVGSDPAAIVAAEPTTMDGCRGSDGEGGGGGNGGGVVIMDGGGRRVSKVAHVLIRPGPPVSSGGARAPSFACGRTAV